MFAGEIDLEDDDGERPVILTVPVCQGIKDLGLLLLPYWVSWTLTSVKKHIRGSDQMRRGLSDRHGDSSLLLQHNNKQNINSVVTN